MDNLRLAESRARKGKSHRKGVQWFDRNPESNLFLLHEQLLNNNFVTSEYKTFNIYEPKERVISSLPYYPDRIVHHAIMNVLEPLFSKWFTADTYSSIKGRGIHLASNKLKEALRDKAETSYCLKIDIKKFYPSINHGILKSLLRRKVKDERLLSLLDEIICSTQGVPIGNYLSQYFANFYLTGFDHFIKQDLRIKYYFRYADDIVILSNKKSHLHEVLAQIRAFLQSNLKLELKQNYQVFPVEKRGIDFVGYVFFHTHVLLRKSIKKRFAKAVSKKRVPATIAAYYGWAKHCNSKNLLKKLIPNEYLQLQRIQHQTST